MRTISITRRAALVGALFTAVSAGTARAAMVQGHGPLAPRLQKALSRFGTRATEMRLIVVHAAETRRGDATRLEAVVDMVWPPGERRRKFVVLDPDPDTAYVVLVGNVLVGLPEEAGVEVLPGNRTLTEATI